MIDPNDVRGIAGQLTKYGFVVITTDNIIDIIAALQQNHTQTVIEDESNNRSLIPGQHFLKLIN